MPWNSLNLVMGDVRQIRMPITGHRRLLRPMDRYAIADRPDVFEIGAILVIDLHAILEQLELRLRRDKSIDRAGNADGDEHDVGLDSPWLGAREREADAVAGLLDLVNLRLGPRVDAALAEDRRTLAPHP